MLVLCHGKVFMRWIVCSVNLFSITGLLRTCVTCSLRSRADTLSDCGGCIGHRSHHQLGSDLHVHPALLPQAPLAGEGSSAARHSASSGRPGSGHYLAASTRPGGARPRTSATVFIFPLVGGSFADTGWHSRRNHTLGQGRPTAGACGVVLGIPSLDLVGLGGLCPSPPIWHLGVHHFSISSRNAARPSSAIRPVNPSAGHPNDRPGDMFDKTDPSSSRDSGRPGGYASGDRHSLAAHFLNGGSGVSFGPDEQAGTPTSFHLLDYHRWDHLWCMGHLSPKDACHGLTGGRGGPL